MSVSIGSEVMTQAARRLDADAVSHQTHHVEGAGRGGGGGVGRWRGGAWRGGSQLDGVVHTEVLQLDQLAFRHPDMPSGCTTVHPTLTGDSINVHTCVLRML